LLTLYVYRIEEYDSVVSPNLYIVRVTKYAGGGDNRRWW